MSWIPEKARWIVTAALLWITACVIALIASAPFSWLGFAMAALAVAATLTLIRTGFTQIVATAPHQPIAESDPPNRSDFRMSRMVNLVSSACDPLPDGTGRPSAAQLQRELLTLAQARVRHNAATGSGRSTQVPADLLTRLTADPAPAMDIRTAQNLITRIEEL
ncbi:hypothetical protein ACMYYO_05475 [Dermacoccaceae bacterium W4C1]